MINNPPISPEAEILNTNNSTAFHHFKPFCYIMKLGICFESATNFCNHQILTPYPPLCLKNTCLEEFFFSLKNDSAYL